MSANTYIAVEEIIESVWTLRYRRVSDYSIEVVSYSRNDRDGYKNTSRHAQVKLIESQDGKRTLVGAVINGVRNSVVNPGYIFSFEA